jgi:hypothetical protein
MNVARWWATLCGETLNKQVFHAVFAVLLQLHEKAQAPARKFVNDGKPTGHWPRRPIFWHARPVGQRKNMTLAAIAVVALAVIGAGGYFAYQHYSPTEQALAQMRTMPLVGLAIADHPEIEDSLRQAIEEEQRNPTTQGPSRPLIVVGQLRHDLIAPALRHADDDSVVAAMAARVKLVEYLQKTNPPACREFSMNGISHVDKLDEKGQQLFRDVLVAMETAYRNGRSGKPQPIPDRKEVGDMLRQAGFTKTDFDKLNSFATLSDDVSCEMELKIDSAPPLLPADKRGPFSRFIIAR